MNIMEMSPNEKIMVLFADSSGKPTDLTVQGGLIVGCIWVKGIDTALKTSTIYALAQSKHISFKNHVQCDFAQELIKGTNALQGTITCPLPADTFEDYFPNIPFWWDIFLRSVEGSHFVSKV